MVKLTEPSNASNTKSEVAKLKGLYRSFIDTTFESLFRTSREGKIIFANHLFLQTFAFRNYRSAKDVNLATLFEDPTHFQRLSERIEAREKIISETVIFKQINGTRLIGAVNCRLHQDASGMTVINWAMLNITNQIESERVLKSRNEKLDKLNHQMEKFLYSTSHDLRSPLTSILGLVNLMRMETKDGTILDYVGKIECSTIKLDNIIKDIMSFSRTTYQRTTSEKIDFETLVWKSIKLHTTDPTLRKINFEVHRVGSFPFFNDPERVDIVIENIIRNAIHFYDANKSRSFAKVNVTAEKDQVKLEFIDNGIGIGRQHLENIFNMFYKATQHSKGAGLGLFIVKEALEKLHGTVHVESEIGFGTVVRISIPNDHKGRLMCRKLELLKNNP